MVSIIIPSFNAAATIELAIISVLQQDNDDVEIVVIDGKSTDGTLTILDDISFRVNAGAFGNKLFRYVSETDKGIYDAMNKGIELSRGDWLFFLGADDILLPDFSVACNHLLLNNVVYYCNTFLNKHYRVYDGEFNKFKLSIENISHQTIFYPRSVFSHYKYDLSYKIVADYMLNLNLCMDKAFGFQYIPLVISVYNESGCSNHNLDVEFYDNKFNLIKIILGYKYAIFSSVFDYFHLKFNLICKKQQKKILR